MNFSATNLDEIGAPGTGLRTAIEQGSLNYYLQADPRGLRRDLTSFKQRNGFNDPGAVIGNASFANSGDLGFGRNTNCTKRPASYGRLDVACYVTNYGDITTPDQQDADNAHANTGPVATEYSRVENPASDPLEFPDDNRTVKFYVFKEASPSPITAGQGNGRAISANLARRHWRAPRAAALRRLSQRRLRAGTRRPERPGLARAPRLLAARRCLHGVALPTV